MNEEFERTKSQVELFEILAKADEDVKCGRVAPIKDTFDDLRNNLKENKA